MIIRYSVDISGRSSPSLWPARLLPTCLKITLKILHCKSKFTFNSRSRSQDESTTYLQAIKILMHQDHRGSALGSKSIYSVPSVPIVILMKFTRIEGTLVHEG